jgi:hypothetical protein
VNRDQSRSSISPVWNKEWLGLVDVHRDEKRFILRAEEKLTAFLELENAISEFVVDLIS